MTGTTTDVDFGDKVTPGVDIVDPQHVPAAGLSGSVPGRVGVESVRLGGVPLLAVLSGLWWQRVNDTLGPVVRDCDGRVFTFANLSEMLTVQPFPSLTS